MKCAKRYLITCLLLLSATLKSMNQQEKAKQEETSFLYAFMKNQYNIVGACVTFNDFQDGYQYKKSSEWCSHVIAHVINEYKPVNAIALAWKTLQKAPSPEHAKSRLQKMIAQLTAQDHWEFAHQECYRLICSIQQGLGKDVGLAKKTQFMYLHSFLRKRPWLATFPENLPKTRTLVEYLYEAYEKIGIRRSTRVML